MLNILNFRNNTCSLLKLSLRNFNKKLNNTGSPYEKIAMKELLNIKNIKNVIREYKIKKSSPKCYDFYFRDSLNNKYLLEVDGSQHFLKNYLNNGTRNLSKQQERDVYYTIMAINKNYKIIRIDKDQIKFIKKHINNFMISDKQSYFTSERKYKHILKSLEFCGNTFDVIKIKE